MNYVGAILVSISLIIGFIYFDSRGAFFPDNNDSSIILPTPRPTKKVKLSPSKSKLVSVKYRNDSVNVGSSNFEYLPTTSSFVNGAWYDQSNEYMIIKLNSTYYHYCGLPKSGWRSFKQADSYGSHYNSRIKGRFDCRTGYVPDY